MSILKVLTNDESISRLKEVKMIVRLLVKTKKLCGMENFYPTQDKGQMFLLEKSMILSKCKELLYRPVPGRRPESKSKSTSGPRSTYGGTTRRAQRRKSTEQLHKASPRQGVVETRRRQDKGVAKVRRRQASHQQCYSPIPMGRKDHGGSDTTGGFGPA